MNQQLFLMKTKIAFILFLCSPILLFSQAKNARTPEEAVNLIKKNVTCQWAPQTVDTFKAGDPASELKGIAVCMFADMNTLQEAVGKGCNFIITHEPVFYNHSDQTDTYVDDPVFKEKMDYINRHRLVIFRFHDHIHMTNPDGISTGMIRKLGLEPYLVNETLNSFRLPAARTLKEYSTGLKKTLGMETIRVIGNPDMEFTKIHFMAGAPGGQRHIQMLSGDDAEVLIAGEANEWETYLYAQDAFQQGRNKAVIFLGHIKSEEAGMEYCAEWLESFIKGVPVHFIENKPNFRTF